MLDFTGASCLEDGVKIDAFFPDDDENHSRAAIGYAKLICKECPLKEACFNEAVAGEYQGVWGGMTAIERKRKVSNLKRAKSTGPGTLAHQMARTVNKQRSALAADINIPIYKKGLEEQGAAFPEDFRRVVEARIQNPSMSLAELGVYLGTTKDDVAGKLRRLKVAVSSGRALKWDSRRI